MPRLANTAPKRRPLPVVTTSLDSRDHLLKQLSERIIGQPEALETIIPRVQLFRAGLNPEGRPAGAFMLLGPTGVGKELPITTQVLTPDGWQQIGKINVGDKVIGSNGKATTVTGVYPQGIKPVYRLTLSDSSTVLCGAEHLWEVERKSHNRKVKSVVTTLDLRFRDKMPLLSSPVEFNESPLPGIGGYTLGYLIGNGSLSDKYSCGYTAHASDLPHVFARITAEGEEQSTPQEKTGCSWVYIGRGANHRIKALELDVHSRDKFIPRLALQAPPAYRIALLQGLMDSDGSASKTRNRVSFHTTAPQLAYDVRELVEGLGGIASISEYDRSHHQKPTEYKVRLRLPLNIAPFSVPRKAVRAVPVRCGHPVRTVKSVSLAGTEHCVCISVDAPDSLYVTEQCILTHNTATVEALAEVIHGSRKNVLRIDCGEFQMEHEVAKLIGAPPGYLGHRETQPALTQVKLNQVMSDRANIAIVLFDEIEKAAPSLLRILLGVLDKGQLRLGDNTTVQFERTLIFFTSNLGSADIARETSGGYGLSKAAPVGAPKDLSKVTSAALKNRLPSEFMNRIDAFVTYGPLSEKDVAKILDIELQNLANHISRRLGAQSVYLSVPTKTRSWLIQKGFSTLYGARELKRTVQKHLLEPLAELLIARAIPPGEIVHFTPSRNGESLKLTFDAGDSKTAVSERGSLQYIFKKEAGISE